MHNTQNKLEPETIILKIEIVLTMHGMKDVSPLNAWLSIEGLNAGHDKITTYIQTNEQANKMNNVGLNCDRPIMNEPPLHTNQI